MPYDWWCKQPGDVLEQTDCGDGDGVDDWVCINPDTWMRKVLLSSSNCSDDYGPAAPRSLCPPRFASAYVRVLQPWRVPCVAPLAGQLMTCAMHAFEGAVCACHQYRVHSLVPELGGLLVAWGPSLAQPRTRRAAGCAHHNIMCFAPLWHDRGNQQGSDDAWHPPSHSCRRRRRRLLIDSAQRPCATGPGATHAPGTASRGSAWTAATATASTTGSASSTTPHIVACCSPLPIAPRAIGPMRTRPCAHPTLTVRDWSRDHVSHLFFGWACLAKTQTDSAAALLPPGADLPCALPWDGWCVGENLLREQADCGDGDTVLDWTCIETNTSRRGVLLSSNCTQDHWGDPDKSLCPARFASERCCVRCFYVLWGLLAYMSKLQGVA